MARKRLRCLRFSLSFPADWQGPDQALSHVGQVPQCPPTNGFMSASALAKSCPFLFAGLQSAVLPFLSLLFPVHQFPRNSIATAPYLSPSFIPHRTSPRNTRHQTRYYQQASTQDRRQWTHSAAPNGCASMRHTGARPALPYGIPWTGMTQADYRTMQQQHGQAGLCTQEVMMERAATHLRLSLNEARCML